MVALRFLRAAREDGAIRELLSRLDPAQGLEPVVAVAAVAGFALDIDILRAAHAHDWALRRVRYTLAASRPEATAEKAAGAML